MKMILPLVALTLLLPALPARAATLHYQQYGNAYPLFLYGAEDNGKFD